MCMCVGVHACVSKYVGVREYAYMGVCALYMCVCAWIRMYMCEYMGWACVYRYVCIYVHMCSWVCGMHVCFRMHVSVCVCMGV